MENVRLKLETIRNKLTSLDTMKFVASWTFFSITTSISFLALLKRFNAIETHSFVDSLLDIYIAMVSSLHRLSEHIPVVITKEGALVASSWIIVYTPAFIAIYKQVKTRNGKHLFYLGLLTFLMFSSLSLDGNGGSFVRSPLSQIFAVCLWAVVHVALFTRGWDSRKTALIDFGKTLVGALFIWFLLVLAGLADLIE